MVRIDMSEYQERHTVSRLVGAPPGYVGYEEGGQLTEAVRRKPYSVVLFDEIEKAHADVFNTLLQVLDDGRLTDAQGRTVDFRNTVVIMTSNIGSPYLLEGVTDAGELKPEARDLVLAELRRHFRPEFLNRVDDIVLFKPLTEPEIERIVELMLDDLRARLADRRMTLEVSEDARRHIAEQGFDPVYGARPLRRFIAHEVETRIGRALLGGDVHDGAAIRVELVDGELARDVREPGVRGRGGMTPRRARRRSDESWCVRHAGARTACRPPPSGVPRCGHCHSPLPWIAEADDGSYAPWSTRPPSRCSSTCGRRGVGHAA